MNYFAAIATIGALAVASTAPVQAADLPVQVPAAIVAPYEGGWQIRVRALGVLPQESNNDVVVNGVNAFGGGTIGVTDAVIPELDITYYFTRNLAVELVLGTAKHHADTRGPLAAAIGSVGLGSTWILPPTLLLQYHFTDFGAFKPYVGVGVNYTFFYGEKDGALVNFSLRDNWGFALQVGFDYMIDRHWGINVDVKKLFLQTTATGTLGINGPPVSSRIDLDPWLVGVGVTYRF